MLTPTSRTIADEVDPASDHSMFVLQLAIAGIAAIAAALLALAS